MENKSEGEREKDREESGRDGLEVEKERDLEWEHERAGKKSRRSKRQGRGPFL